MWSDCDCFRGRNLPIKKLKYNDLSTLVTHDSQIWSAVWYCSQWWDFIIWPQKYARCDWLFSWNDQELFSCNGWALLARCPRHIKSVFNLTFDILMDIHVMINWQLSKRVSADRFNLTVSLTQVFNAWVDVLFKVIRWPVVGFYWS